MNLIQKKRLARRSSPQVRNEVDLFRDVPVESEAQLRELARAANRAADRMIKNLDETIACVDGVLRQRGNSKKKSR